jgi:hypothetical protein
MKLDESIELKNKKQNIKEMNNLNNLPISEMRIAMQEMMEIEETSGCLYEVLVNEGFLPNELNEGSDYATELSTMMEDDDIMSEMYKSCTMNESECGGKMQEWLNEKLYGKQKQLDMNNNGEIDANDFAMMRKDEEIHEGSYPEGEHYKKKITQICNDLADVNRMMDDNAELPSWIQDKMAVMYHSADAIKSYLHGDTEMNGINESEDDEDDESPTYLIAKKRVLDDEISKYIKYLEMFKPMLEKLNPESIKTYFQPQSEFSLEGFKEFLTKNENQSSIDFYNEVTKEGDQTYKLIFDGLVNPRKRGFFVRYGKEIGLETLENMEELLSRIFDLSNSIYLKNRDIQRIDNKIKQRGEKDTESNSYDNSAPRLASKDELDVLSADALNLGMDYSDDEDLLEEVDLPKFTPIKGKNVDSTNKTDSNKENKEGTTDADDSQETTEEKVDNLKNQKYEKNDNETKVDELLHGFNNTLDLDYNNELTDEQIDKIKDEVMGTPPKDHANVDHDSKGGEMLYGAAKKRAEEGITQNNYTSKPDRNTILPKQEYEKTQSLKENAEIERLKNLFKYTDTVISENKKHTLDENKIFFDKVSTKKPI